jgi:translocation and assembly module TamB
MRLGRTISVTLVVLLLVGLFAVLGVLRSDFFWRWAGGKAVALIQERLQPQLQVGEITGNIFDGLFFKDISLTTDEEDLFRARSLEIRLSLWSLFELKPVFSRVALHKPRLALRQDKDGRWNIADLLRPAGPPAPGPEEPAQLPVPLRAVKFSQILIIDGQVEITQGGETRKIRNLDLDLGLRVDNPLGPEQTITVDRLLAAAPAPFGRLAAGGRLTYGKNVLNVPKFEVKSGDKVLFSLAGAADLTEGGPIQADGRLSLSAREIGAFWEQWPAEGDLAAKVNLQGTTSQVRLTLEGKFREVTLDAAGTLGHTGEAWEYNLTGDLRNLSPDLLALFDAELAKKIDQLSPLALKFQVQGAGLSFPPAHMSLNLESGPWQYGKARVERLKLSLNGDRDNQEFQGSVKSNMGALALKAQGSLLTGAQGKFSLQVDSLNPGPLDLGAPAGTVVSGKLAGTFTSPGWHALDRLTVTGDLEAGGRLGPHAVKTQARLAWDIAKLEIPRAAVQVGNLSAELQGTLVGDVLNFSHRGKSGTGGNWPIPAQLGGQFSWEGTLRGTLADPEVALRAQGRGLSFDRYSVRTFSMDAQGSGWPPSEGRVALQATGLQTPVGAFAQANLRANGDDQLWTFDLNASGPKEAKVDLRGSAHLCDRWLSLERAMVRLKNFHIQNLGPVDISFAPGIEIKPVVFKINQGRAALEASLTGGQVSGRLELQNLAAEWFAPQGVPLKGAVAGRVNLSGEARRPVLQGEVSLGPGRYQEVDFQSLRTSFGYRDNRLSLNGSLQTRTGGPTLSWDGHLPVALTLMPFSYALGQNGMRVALKGENVDLSLLPSFTKEVERAQGPLKLEAKIEGAVHKPQVSGQISWEAGSVKLRRAGATYQLQPGEIRFQNNRIAIPQLTLENKGTATLSGDITLAGFLPDEVGAKLRLDNFKAIDKLGSEALVSGAVNLSGRWPNLAVQGNLLIPQATFRLSFLNLGTTATNKDIVLVKKEEKPVPEKPKAAQPPTTPESEVWRNLTVDLEVQAPKNVWVDDRAAKIEAAVDVKVRKRPDQELTYVGAIQALQGKVFIVGREFQVTRGIVTLPAQPGAEPTLNARIEYETGDVTLFADATGPVSSPKITLRGEPGITETDWMSYLLYGKPVAALSREEQGAAMAAGAFGGLATKMILQDFLGMAPPITKGLTITYQHRNDPLYRDDPYQVVIQYRINRRFSVQSQVGGRNTGGDVLFNWDF